MFLFQNYPSYFISFLMIYYQQYLFLKHQIFFSIWKMYLKICMNNPNVIWNAVIQFLCEDFHFILEKIPFVWVWTDFPYIYIDTFFINISDTIILYVWFLNILAQRAKWHNCHSNCIVLNYFSFLNLFKNERFVLKTFIIKFEIIHWIWFLIFIFRI